MEKPFRRRDLLGIRDLSAEEIIGILDTAENFREINSARDQKSSDFARENRHQSFFRKFDAHAHISFELAAKRLSADAVNISAFRLRASRKAKL